MGALTRDSLSTFEPPIDYNDPDLIQRYAEKTFSREGISIFTNHHVERVEAVRKPTTELLNLILIITTQGRMIVKEQGEGMLIATESDGISDSFNSSLWHAGVEHWFGAQSAYLLRHRDAER